MDDDGAVGGGGACVLHLQDRNIHRHARLFRASGGDAPRLAYISLSLCVCGAVGHSSGGNKGVGAVWIGSTSSSLLFTLGPPGRPLGGPLWMRSMIFPLFLHPLVDDQSWSSGVPTLLYSSKKKKKKKLISVHVWPEQQIREIILVVDKTALLVELY